MAARCWASMLGGCDRISGEHVISRSVLEDVGPAPVIVECVHRVPPGQYSVNSLTANILCRKHNSQLSPLDATAGLIAAFMLTSGDALPGRVLKVDGNLLERWLAKTVINYMFAGWAEEKKWPPHEDIVRTIFGEGSAPDGCGMFAVQSDALPIKSNNEVAVTLMWEQNPEGQKRPVGAFVSLHRLPLFLALSARAAQRFESGDVLSGPSRYLSQPVRLKRHPDVIMLGENGVAHSEIRFHWTRVST